MYVKTGMNEIIRWKIKVERLTKKSFMYTIAKALKININLSVFLGGEH